MNNQNESLGDRETAPPKKAESSVSNADPSTVVKACTPDALVSAQTPDEVAREYYEALTGPPVTQTAAEDYGGMPAPHDSAGQSAEKVLPRVPGYEVRGVLGRGGMGIVYEAWQTELNRTVAIKMLLAGFHARPDQLARFRSEAHAVARLQHPNIIQIHDIGDHEGHAYFSLEFANGGNLGRKLNGKPLPPVESAETVEILARAMHYAHQRRIIHRDLKPTNILLTADGTLKISDFGLAKIQESAEESLSQTGLILGTASYMAPEQAWGKIHEIGPITDVYALGAILYETMTGRAPFVGTNSMETVEQVRTQEPLPPGRLQPKLPRDLETICLKCLQKEQHRRYPSALALADDLRRFINREPIQARRVPAWERGYKWVRRRPALATALALGVLTVLSAAGGFAQYQQHQIKEKDQQLHLNDLRADVRTWISSGKEAIAIEQWEKAQDSLGKAVALSASESLEDLKEQAEKLLETVTPRLEEKLGHAKANTRMKQFEELRNDAFYYVIRSAGENAEEYLDRTISSARGALDVFGLDNSNETLVLDRYFSAAQKADIDKACYELRLVMAEAMASARVTEESAKRAQQALRILDQTKKQAASSHRPAYKAYYLLRARVLESLNRKSEADAETASARQCQPAGAFDFFLLGDAAYKQQGDLDQAAMLFSEALRKEPDQFWSRYFLSVCYIGQMRFDLARDGLTACLKERPDLTWIYLMRGFVYGQLDQFQSAEEDFGRAFKLNPSGDDEYVFYANRGLTRMRQARLNDLFPQLSCYLSNPLAQAKCVLLAAAAKNLFQGGIDDLNKAIKLKPNSYEAYLTLAQGYQQKKDFDAAFRVLGRAIVRQSRKENSGHKRDRALLHRSRARLHVELKDFEAAQRDLSQAADLEGPASEWAAQDRAEQGRLSYIREMYAESLARLDGALRDSPGFVIANLWQADTFLKLQRYPQAIASVDAYLKDNSAPATQAYRVRGYAKSMLATPDHRGAVEDYSRALAMEPADVPTLLSRGHCYLALNSPVLALPDFEEALRLDPKNGDAYTARGHTFLRAGKLKKAIADAEQAIRVGSAQHRTMYNAARIFAQAVAQLDSEPGRTRPTTLEQRAQYQDRALVLIRKSLELVAVGKRAAFWQDTVRTDAALDPIRRSVGYARMDAEYRGSDKKLSDSGRLRSREFKK